MLRRTHKSGEGIVQDLGCPLHGLYLLILQTTNRQRHHAIEYLHAQVVVVVLLKLGGGIDDVRRILAVVAVNIFAIVEAAGYGTVFGVGFDTFDEILDGSRRELQRIFLVSKY